MKSKTISPSMPGKNAEQSSLRHSKKAVRRFFILTFTCACLIFWWLPSLLYRFIPELPDRIQSDTINISLLAWTAFIFGFILFQVSFRSVPIENLRRLDVISQTSQKLTVALFIPALFYSIKFLAYRNTMDYGQGQGLSDGYQLVLYSHLFFGLMYLSTTKESTDLKVIWFVAMMVIMPRLIVSLGWGRFFLAQSLVPILLIGIARGWVEFNARKILKFLALALIVFFVPAITRGDSIFGAGEIFGFFANGSTLGVYQENISLDISKRCSPIFVSFAAKLVPFGELGLCTINIWGIENMPATLDRLLAFEEIGYADLLIGPGSNYLLELHLLGGLYAVVIGSLIFGASCRFFAEAIAHRSIYAGIWAECLTRALFAPRGNLGYVYEKIPMLMIGSFFLYLLFLWVSKVKKSHLFIR